MYDWFHTFDFSFVRKILRFLDLVKFFGSFWIRFRFICQDFRWNFIIKKKARNKRVFLDLSLFFFQFLKIRWMFEKGKESRGILIGFQNIFLPSRLSIILFLWYLFWNNIWKSQKKNLNEFKEIHFPFFILHFLIGRN